MKDAIKTYLFESPCYAPQMMSYASGCLVVLLREPKLKQV